MRIQTLPVVMAGGNGTRLWPLSRVGSPSSSWRWAARRACSSRPSHRLLGIAADDIELAPPLVVGNDEHRFLVLEQLRELGTPNRGSAARAGRTQHRAGVDAGRAAGLEAGGDPVLVVVARRPDRDRRPRLRAVAAAGRAMRRRRARSSSWASSPTGPKPATATYAPTRWAEGSPGWSQFVEKPDLATAARYLAEGGYCWNSGIFVLKASVWLAALERVQARHPRSLAQGVGGERSTPSSSARARPSSRPCLRIGRLRRDGALPRQRIRHPHGAPRRRLERPRRLGRGLADGREGRRRQCVRRRRAAAGRRNTLVHATSRLVSVVGLDDVVVVETPDAVMVADRAPQPGREEGRRPRSARKRGEQRCIARCTAPGAGTTASTHGARFQVKRIMVKPGASLSLQMHHHRAEHWIVVSGTAEVTNGDKVILLSENQSTYIPLGESIAWPTGQGAAGDHRGAVGLLPGRGRHRPLRGHVREMSDSQGDPPVRGHYLPAPHAYASTASFETEDIHDIERR